MLILLQTWTTKYDILKLLNFVTYKKKTYYFKEKNSLHIER